MKATLATFDEVVKVIKEKKEGGVELLKNAEVQKRLLGAALIALGVVSLGLS